MDNKKHRLIKTINFQSNFLGDQDEVRCLKDICSYITHHITTEDPEYKVSDIQLDAAMVYISIQVNMLCLFEYKLIGYLRSLFDKVIEKYSEREEFIYCHNLQRLRDLYLDYYKNYIYQRERPIK